jgi:EamA domain-containing membrane protein RarD
MNLDTGQSVAGIILLLSSYMSYHLFTQYYKALTPTQQYVLFGVSILASFYLIFTQKNKEIGD